jgi:hypothetical protein
MLMTAGGEHESQATGWFSCDAWLESVVIARQIRQQRGESYLARHRRSSFDDDADTEDETQRSD